jgi:hypothetical protein
MLCCLGLFGKRGLFTFNASYQNLQERNIFTRCSAGQKHITKAIRIDWNNLQMCKLKVHLSVIFCFKVRMNKWNQNHQGTNSLIALVREKQMSW